MYFHKKIPAERISQENTLFLSWAQNLTKDICSKVENNIDKFLLSCLLWCNYNTIYLRKHAQISDRILFLQFYQVQTVRLSAFPGNVQVSDLTSWSSACKTVLWTLEFQSSYNTLIFEISITQLCSLLCVYPNGSCSVTVWVLLRQATNNILFRTWPALIIVANEIAINTSSFSKGSISNLLLFI